MMTIIQRPRDVINQDLAAIRALNSITSQQAGTITLAVQASRRAWDVQTIDDYDGYLSIFIEPNVGTDTQKAFFISGTTQRLELFETSGDNMIFVASFTDADSISAKLIDLIGQAE